MIRAWARCRSEVVRVDMVSKGRYWPARAR